MVINDFLSMLFGREIRLAYYTASCIGAKNYTKLGNGYCCAGVILIRHKNKWMAAYCFRNGVNTLLDENTDDFTPEQWVVVRKVIQSIEKRIEEVDEMLKQKELVTNG